MPRLGGRVRLSTRAMVPDRRSPIPRLQWIPLLQIRLWNLIRLSHPNRRSHLLSLHRSRRRLRTVAERSGAQPLHVPLVEGSFDLGHRLADEVRLREGDLIVVPTEFLGAAVVEGEVRSR